MPLYIATVELLLDVDSESEAADAVNEILREQQNDFAMDSCLVDYAHGPTINTQRPYDPNGYSEGEFTTWGHS